MPCRDRALQIDFDFCAHELVLHTSDAREERIPLTPMPTAEFYARDARTPELDVDVPIWTMPVEIEGAIPFEQIVCMQATTRQGRMRSGASFCSRPRVQRLCARFLGKTSPSHFFWGSFDLR